MKVSIYGPATLAMPYPAPKIWTSDARPLSFVSFDSSYLQSSIVDYAFFAS